MYGRRSRHALYCFVWLIRYVDKMRGLATIIGGKEEDLRTQMMTAGMALAGEFAGAEPGDPTGIMFLRQVRKMFYCIRQRYTSKLKVN